MFNYYGLKWPTSKALTDTIKVLSVLRAAIVAVGVPIILLVGFNTGAKFRGNLSEEVMLITTLFGLFFLFSHWAEDYKVFACSMLFCTSYGAALWCTYALTQSWLSVGFSAFSALTLLIIFYCVMVFGFTLVLIKSKNKEPAEADIHE